MTPGSPTVTDIVFITGSLVDAKRFKEVLKSHGYDVKPHVGDGPAAARNIVVFFAGLTDTPENLVADLEAEAWTSASVLYLWPEVEDKPFVELFRSKRIKVVRAVRRVECGVADR